MRVAPLLLAASAVLVCSAHAVPVDAQSLRTAAAVPPQVTALIAEINAARAVARTCGTTQFAAAPALRANSSALTRVSQSQAQSMATAGALSHPGQNTTRLAAAGYKATVAIDLVAGDSGSGTAASTVAGWLASPAHCAVVMDPQFVDLGVGYAENNASTTSLKHFWVGMFARP